MRIRILVLLALAAGAMPAPPAQAQDMRAPYARVAKQSDAVVHIRYVMTVSAFGQENRQDMHTLGTLVTAEGLILAPDAQVNPELPDRAAPTGDGSDNASRMSVKTTEFKVLLNGREDWLPLTMLTHDSGLGIAWLRLDAADAKLPFVDLSRRTEPVVGDPYFVLARTGPDLGRAAMVVHGYLWGEVQGAAPRVPGGVSAGPRVRGRRQGAGLRRPAEPDRAAQRRRAGPHQHAAADSGRQDRLSHEARARDEPRHAGGDFRGVRAGALRRCRPSLRDVRPTAPRAPTRRRRP
jgi:hypothetical protein